VKRLNVMLATVLAWEAVEITAQRAALPPANLPRPFREPARNSCLRMTASRVTSVAQRSTNRAPSSSVRAGRRTRARHARHHRRRRIEAQRHQRGRRHHAQLKGLTHVEEGTSDAPLHAIMIELKQDAPVGDDPSADLPPAFPREGAKQLLENDRVRVWDYTFTPHRVGPLHRHVRDAVAVWLEGGKLKATSRDGTSNVNTQTRFTATYSRRGGVHTEEAIEGAPHAYVFELK
jgi:hypothetical protein